MCSVQVWYSVVLVILLRESYVKGSTQWPRGEYVLLRPKTGCPTKWKDKAWILQDTKSKGSNERSKILHIDGYVASYYVVRSFCIRTGTEGSSVWPQGQYCIYRPKRFSSGSIKMTGEHNNNKDAVKYTSSFVDYYDETSNKQKKHIEFHFQCKTSGNKKIPISLPINKPFYLLPYGSRDCQQVKWMVSTTEWIKYRTENAMKGTVPAYQLENNNGIITMFYCYYKSCNYTLANKKGVFQSPGFPGEYPDGQLCSWRITVPVNRTVQVRFTNFSLYENDTLRYSTRSNGKFSSWYTIPLNLSVPFTLLSDSDVLFVFSSDESNNSSGFRAEYRVPQATTTPNETSTASTASTATPSETSSILLTTPCKTKKKKSSTPEKDDIQTTTQTTNSKSTAITKTNISITPQQTKTTQEPSPLTNCTAGNRVKEALTNSNEWNGKLVVIVIPLACLLIVILLVVDIVYHRRLKAKTSSDSASETRHVDQLPLVVNPTYDRGAILLTQPNDTTTSTTILEVNENGTGMTQSVFEKPPDYEDVDNWKPKNPTPNMDLEIPECNGSNACSDTQGGLFDHDTTTTEEKSKTSENPFYESVLTSPPLVEGNDLYESIKIDKGKAE